MGYLLMLKAPVPPVGVLSPLPKATTRTRSAAQYFDFRQSLLRVVGAPPSGEQPAIDAPEPSTTTRGIAVDVTIPKQTRGASDALRPCDACVKPT
jgi:hypothetical protein